MRRWLAMVLAFAMVATACSKSDDTDATAASTAASVASTVASSGDDSTTTSSTIAEEGVDPALLESMPVDRDVRVGSLENGLTYYIRFNDSPGGRAELRLAVNAGSVLEDDDQSGGAHFLEHMMFNGTEKYPANELIAVLESFGPQFGPDINAYTSFDETVYELSVPTDDPAILDEAMEVLFQWSRHATLATEEVELERGVVVEEWRVRDQGFDGRVSNAFSDLILAGTPYEDQLPIGEFDSISEMDPGPLKRFYDDWYRPELMAVVIVGDIDLDEVEAAIADHFGSLTNPAGSPPRPELTVVPPSEAKVTSLSDPESTTPSVDLIYGVEVTGGDTVGDLQRDVAISMAMEMIDNRLSEDVLRGAVPFFSADTYDFSYSREISGRGFSVSSDEDNLTASVESILVEVARAEQFGFHPSEFDRVVKSFDAVTEQLWEGQDSRQDYQFAAEYVAHFLSGAPIPSIDQLYDVRKEILERLTVEDVERAFSDLIAGSAPSLLVVGPDAPASVVPSEATLLQLVDSIGAMVLEPRPDDGASVDVLMVAPDPTAPLSTSYNEYYGFLELEYANGARVFFWATEIADNLVSFEASSFGGVSQLAVEDITEIEYGIDMIANSGLGGLSQIEVDRVLSDQIVELSPYITLTHEGFFGTAATEDLETLFQLIHLSFVLPQIDDVAVDRILTEARPVVESPEDVPSLMASIALSELYYGPDDVRHWVVPTIEDFNAFDAQRALAIYRERFGNAGEFLFGFVGDATEDDLIAFANHYIGTLPGALSNEGFIDHQPLPQGEHVRTVEAGQDDQGLVQFTFTNFVNDQDATSDVTADLLELIGNNRIRDRIREKLSASYSPFMAIDMQLEPDPYIESYVSVSGDPDRLDEIAAEVLADISDLRKNGPTAEQLAIAQEQLLREYELVNNPFLLERVIFFKEHPDRELVELSERYDIIATITASDIRALARVAFPVGSYIEVKLVPAA